MRETKRIATIAALCAAAAGCALAPLTGDLRSAREACNRDYPRRIGNYLPNAECVNAAIEAYAHDRGVGLLGLQVSQGNPAAISLYASLGFEPVDENRFWVQG